MESLKISGFRNINALVNGPFWILFEAVRIETGTRHLLQVLDESVSQDREFAALVRESLHLSSGLHHEAILQPHAVEEASGRLILVYEFFNARSLQTMLDSHLPFVERRVTTIVRLIAEAFQYAQIRGVRHGWLSPQVILLAKFQDEVKIFGFSADAMLAYLYDKRQDIAASVNPYLPPENLALATQPAPDDCYALGVLFYQLLLGKLPFAQEKIIDLKQEKCTTIIPPNKENPKISHAVSDMVLSLLDPRPQSRAGLSSLLNILKPPTEDNVHLNGAPAEGESRMSRVRGMFRHVNPVSKNLVGSRKRI
ncbi:protein kinase, partial [candidate division KSB1 bacterium]